MPIQDPGATAPDHAVTATEPVRDPISALVPVWIFAFVAGGVMTELVASMGRHRRSQGALMELILGSLAALVLVTVAPPSRPFALAALAGGGLLSAAVLAPLVLAGCFVLMWPGPGKEDAFVLLVASPLFALLALAAGNAFVRTTPARRRGTGLGTGVPAGLVLVVVVAFQSMRADRPAPPAAAFVPSRVPAVVEAVRGCLARQSDRGGPATPEDLVRLGCLTPEQVRPADGNYTIVVAAPPGQAAPKAFTVCVVRGGRSVYSAQVIDDLPPVAPPPFGPPSEHSADLACGSASGGGLRWYRYCLWRWAARHDGVYPASLAPLAALGPERCVPENWGRGEGYVPGEPDETGRVTTFVLDDVRRGVAGRERTRLDDTGTIRLLDRGSR